MAVIYYIRAQPPTLQCHETILFTIKQPFPTSVPSNMAQFRSLHPELILQLGPITTLGPILQSGPILAEGSIKQFPSLPSLLT